MPTRECVTEEDLRAFLVGNLPEHLAGPVSSHLESCPRCEAAARRLDDLTDPVIRSLRRALGGGSSGGRTAVDTPALASDGPRPRRADGYELLEELGRGGMGMVFRARDRSLNRVVALKMILAGEFASPAAVYRFRTEAEAAAQLDHAHIVPIYEIGEHEGRPFFSMKLIEGASLTAHLSRLAADPRAAVRLLVAVARAIHYAHQRGIIHRDLKPANILIDAAGDPHVTDFGLARRVDGEGGQTQSGALVGTPCYMAPEQARGKKAVTTAVDVYALGAIFYEMLTGRPLFSGDTPLATVLQVLEREPEPPRAVNPAVDGDLELICLKCLAKDPQGRYASAEALAADLEHWLAGEPLSVRVPSFASALRMWLRQNFGAAGWTVVLGLVGGLLFGVTAWLSRAQYMLSEARAAYPRLPGVTPPALAHVARVPTWVTISIALPSLVLIIILGLLVVLLVRPKNRAAEIAAGAVTGLVAGMAGFAFGAGWLFVAFVTLYPETFAESDLRLLSETAWVEPAPEADTPARRATSGRAAAERLLEKYPDLIQVPPPERGDLLYHKIMADLSARTPLGIWLGMVFALSVCVSVSLAETLAAGVLLRRAGQGRAVIGPYIELAVPGAILIVGLASGAVRLSVGWFAAHPAHLLIALLMLCFLALAVTAVLRGCHWLVRAGLHVAWLLSLTAWFLLELPRFSQFGG